MLYQKDMPHSHDGSEDTIDKKRMIQWPGQFLRNKLAYLLEVQLLLEQKHSHPQKLLCHPSVHNRLQMEFKFAHSAPFFLKLQKPLLNSTNQDQNIAQQKKKKPKTSGTSNYLMHAPTILQFRRQGHTAKKGTY